MTPDQLRRLFDELVEFRNWIEQRPLMLGVDDALGVVLLAVHAERVELEAEVSS